MKRGAIGALVLVALCGLFVEAAHAQAVLNPKVVEFDPSPDHAGLNAAGQAIVQRYELQIFLSGGSAPVTTSDLGKPTPESDGKIRVDFSTRLSSWPLGNGTYAARVAAIGPDGSGVSEPSNTFAFDSCSYAVSSAAQRFADTAGTASVTVTAGAGCTWSAVSNAAWLTVSTPGVSGSATVALSVAGNPAATERTATATIAGQAVVVTQAGAPCTYALSSTAQSYASTGGAGSVTVSAPSGCSWNATTSANWVTLGGGVSALGGSSGSSVAYTVAANTTTTARTATITIGGQTLAIAQAAAEPCSFSLSATEQTVNANGGTGSFGLTVRSGCTWTTASSAVWLTVSPASGTGSGTVTFTAGRNDTGLSRSGVITAGGRSLTVNQPVRPSAPKKVRVAGIGQ